jgi:1-acyl-sn-glycerol-3-phosphate acyltransferase
MTEIASNPQDINSTSPVAALGRRRDWEITTPITPIAPLVYHLGRLFSKVSFFLAIRTQMINPQAAQRPGGYLLACTHLSHLEPVCLSALVPRRIDWMTRIEFYRFKPMAWLLRLLDTFPVNRQGVSVKSIRTAIERARMGRVVGLCPEGGVTVGAESALRGGPIKLGACMIACRAGVPIIPCVLLGTHELNRVWPWLPIKQGRLWVIFGSPIAPRPSPSGPGAAKQRRQYRAEMAIQMQQQFKALYEELRMKFGIDDKSIP